VILKLAAPVSAGKQRRGSDEQTGHGGSLEVVSVQLVPGRRDYLAFGLGLLLTISSSSRRAI
jgi:hypothetical protein